MPYVHQSINLRKSRSTFLGLSYISKKGSVSGPAEQVFQECFSMSSSWRRLVFAHLLGSIWEPLSFGLAYSACLRFGLVSCARLGWAGRWVCTWLGSCFQKLGAVSSELLASFFGVQSRTLSAWISINKKRLASVQGVVLFSMLPLHSPPYYAGILPHYAHALPCFQARTLLATPALSGALHLGPTPADLRGVIPRSLPSLRMPDPRETCCFLRICPSGKGSGCGKHPLVR